MSSNNITLADLIEMIASAVAEKIAEQNGGGESPAPAKSKSSKTSTSKASKATEVDEDEDDDEDEAGDDEARRAELTKMRITSLRKIAIEAGFDEDEVKEADKATLVDSIIEAEQEDSEEDEDEPEADSDEDEAEDEDEDEGFDRDELEGKTLAALKKIAKAEGYTVADLKGLDKDAIVDLLVDGDESEDEDDEDEELTEEDLRDMSLAELKTLCKDYGVKVPRGAKADDLIDLLLEEADEDED